MAEDLEQLLTEGVDITVIGYHVNDNYANTYSDARVAYYSMVGLPHVLIDGSQIFSWTYDDILDACADRLATNTYYSLSMDVSRYATSVNASVNVGYIGAPSPETKVLHLVLTESHISESWYGGEYVNHAARLMVPDQNGTLLISDSFDFEFEMDPLWKPENCELLAFVQDTLTKEIVQAQVFSFESTILYNDVLINKIISPGDDYCMTTLSPKIEIANYGADTLKSCLIGYTINDVDYEYNWTGNLSTYQVEQISLTEVSISLQVENVIKFELTLPNGQEDEYPDNNTMTQDFEMAEVLNQLPLYFEVRTDNYGSETSWELLNSQNEVVYSGEGYENNTLYTFEWDLPLEDCYSFIIYDSAGNGICCESGLGFYKIKDNTGETIHIGGNFEGIEISTFEIDLNTLVSSVEMDNEFNIFPNPVDDVISFESIEPIYRITIRDTKGQVLIDKAMDYNTAYSMDVSGLNTGLYIFQAQTQNGWSNLKLLKK